ncbi:MAG: ABC transporter substrate-binding protein [Myxococcaceae bacterium]|nr:ABC transporter substrate-binding protein [Myxococcaceae bacterium]
MVKGTRRRFIGWGFLGGLTLGVLNAAVLSAGWNIHLDTYSWVSMLLLDSVLGMSLGVALLVARSSDDQGRQALRQLAQGDLTLRQGASPTQPVELSQLVLTLRRALSQVQRVTEGLHRTCREVSDQTRSLLEAARRQDDAVNRSQTAVGGMGESLKSAHRRTGQLETFAHDTTNAVTEMTARIEQVAQGLAELNDAAGRTSAQVQLLSERAHGMADAGEGLVAFARQTEDFIGSVEGGIDSVRRRVEETGNLAHEVTLTAEQGEKLVADSTLGIKQLDETVRRAADIVGTLGVRGLEIGRVVDVIQDIADQTNLLALNAAIIANQAGESGQAFGVVAQAVRGLAERTATSTREIAQLVRSVREGVEQAVELVREGQGQASVGVALAQKASGALKEIRAISSRALYAVEASVAETKRLEAQGAQVVAASRKIVARADEVNAQAVEQASAGKELVRHSHDMAKNATLAATKAQAQVRAGRDLSDSLLRLTAAIDEIKAAQNVLTKGQSDITHEVGEVREDAGRIVHIADGLTRAVEQLSREADGLDDEVLRFKLPTPRPGGTLKVGLHRTEGLQATRGLDPLFTIDLQLAELSGALFNTLVRFEDGMLLPDLAERWASDITSKRFRFTLRKDVLFHDGTQLTAHHVKAHFERLLDPRVGSPEQSVLQDVEGAFDFMNGQAREVTGITVLDAHTLDIRLREPRAFFLRLLALRGTAVAKRTEDGRVVGTGPFRPLASAAGHLLFERNPNYFRPLLPYLHQLDFHLCASRDEALALLKAGELHVVSYLHAEHVQQARIENGQLATTQTPSVWFLGFNVSHAPFDDARVRRAIRAGLDVRGLVENFHPGARVARSLTPPTVLEGERVEEPRVDLALAERLLAEAGHRSLKLTLPSRDTRAEDAALFKPLIDAGLVELTQPEITEGYWQQLREGRVPLFRGNWIANVTDPDNFLHLLLNSRAQRYYGLGYKSDALDRLTDEARGQVDPVRRVALYQRAEAVLREDCVLVPLYHERFYVAASPAVQGLRLHPTPPQVRFEALWLES